MLDMVLTTITSSVGSMEWKNIEIYHVQEETTDKYHEDPFRAVNFPIGESYALSKREKLLSSVSKKRKKMEQVWASERSVSV